MTQPSPIERAVKLAGGTVAIANFIGVSPAAVSQWVKGSRPIPVERCTAIEKACQGAVQRWDLRPTDWHHIWPELISRDGAPSPAASPAHGEPAAAKA